MADETTDQSGNRATVAQTLAEVRGVRDFMGASFADVQRQLDRVGDLPLTVAALQAQNYDQERRIKTLERDIDELENQDTTKVRTDSEWRRTHLPALILAAGSLIATIVFIIVSLH